MFLSFIFTELLVLLIILLLLFILSAVWPPDSPWAPWWQMPDEVIEKMCKLVKLSAKDIIYDLGCGTGHAIIYVSKKYGAKSVGIEIDPIRYLIAKWNVKKLNQERNVALLRKNFFDIDISKATVIFVYLVPVALKRLVPKFKKELKKGTRFVSFIYPMPVDLFEGNLKLIHQDKKNKIFVYKLIS